MKNRFSALWRGLRDMGFRFMLWRERHISEKTFVIILALVVGVLCGFAAQLLKFLIHFIG